MINITIIKHNGSYPIKKTYHMSDRWGNFIEWIINDILKGEKQNDDKRSDKSAQDI